jgi:transposase
MSNKKYTKEFKEESKRLILEGGEKVSALSEKLGVSKNTLYKWSKASNRVKGEGNKEELIKENKKLLAALRLAEEERDILKKAAAYFAKVSR